MRLPRSERLGGGCGCRRARSPRSCLTRRRQCGSTFIARFCVSHSRPRLRTRYGSGEILAVPALRKDGKRISIEFTIAPFRDNRARMIGIAAMLRDVTARFEEMRALRAKSPSGSGT
jgi:hypothetical protein